MLFELSTSSAHQSALSWPSVQSALENLSFLRMTALVELLRELEGGRVGERREARLLELLHHVGRRHLRGEALEDLELLLLLEARLAPARDRLDALGGRILLNGKRLGLLHLAALQVAALEGLDFRGGLLHVALADERPRVGGRRVHQGGGHRVGPERKGLPTVSDFCAWPLWQRTGSAFQDFAS